MSRRTKGWLIGGWLVLIVFSWSFTESINDGIAPTSGPRPEPSSSSSSSGCSAPTPSADAERDVAAYADVERDAVVKAVSCTTSD
jgi:CCR4-NOT transcriptional regulation complex NOT5 subunit